MVPFSNWYADYNQQRVTQAEFQSQYTLTKISPNGYIDGSTYTGAGTSAMIGTCPAQSAYNANPPTTIYMDFDGAAGSKHTLCLQQQSGPISLNPGQLAIVYFKVPNGLLSPLDAGSSTDIHLYAGSVGVINDVWIGTS